MADVDAPSIPLPMIAGHAFRLLPDGPARLEALLTLIAEAEHSLRLLYYIFLDDGTAEYVRDALVAARRRGVTVSLLVDGFGSAKAFFAPLIDNNCSFYRYQPERSRRYLLRNHQKMAIADRKRAIIGGFNVAQGYFAAGDAESWRDLGLSVEGPVAERLAEYFNAIVEWSSDPQLEMKDLRSILHSFHEQDGDVRLLFGGPMRELSPWAQTLRNDCIDASQIDIATAYFAPHSALLRPIRKAAQRGRVRIITAAKTDNAVTIAAARNRYRYLLPEAEIYEYQPIMLHTKLYVIDDVVLIGSANFDVRSLYLNLEVMMRIRDAAFADTIRRYFDRELADCRRITAEDYARSQSWWTRFKGRLSYFLVSVLDYNVSRRLNFGIDAQ